ncbi:MAG: hypothetical protein QOF30_1107 [Acidimicrobiaceae bacterium]|jgi:hypothetical protein|nr:hypothetical protein [Acidimicrobiaceae bacterium]
MGRSIAYLAILGAGLVLLGLFEMVLTKDLANDPSESRQAYKFGFRRGARVLVGFGVTLLLVALILAIFGV